MHIELFSCGAWERPLMIFSGRKITGPLVDFRLIRISSIIGERMPSFIADHRCVAFPDASVDSLEEPLGPRQLETSHCPK
eukprot:9499085-Pyramimonas_sp.AAC.1